MIKNKTLNIKTIFQNSSKRERERGAMDMRKIVVVVEDVEAARTAFEWALHNLLRYGDLITLLHVFPKRSRSKKKLRLSRLKGFQLALSFKDICSDFPNYYYRQRSRFFLYKLAMAHNNIASSFNCRVLAVKSNASSSPDSSSIPDSSTNMDFSQIDLAGLHVPDPPPPKIRYRICPSPSAIIWRSSGSSRRKSSSREEAQFRLIRST
ncbi:unnamed protein product, partial [Vitis vinifera]